MEEKIKINTDMDYGTISLKRNNLKSKLIIGKEQQIVIYIEQKFNKLQKKMWKFLLGIKIEDIKEIKNE